MNSWYVRRPSKIASTELITFLAYSPNSVPVRNPSWTNQSSSPSGPATKPSSDIRLDTISRLNSSRFGHDGSRFSHLGYDLLDLHMMNTTRNSQENETMRTNP